MIDHVRLLHEAANRIGDEAPSPEMDTLANAGATFLAESDLSDETGTPIVLTPPVAIGYGIMLGWLAREAAFEE